MEQLFSYLNTISPIGTESAEALAALFEPQTLAAGDFFIKEGAYAKEVGFLYEGVIRAFFINQEGKEYNKQFFVAPSIIGAYSSLLTGQQNQIAQQALTACTIWKAPYSEIEHVYTKHHDLERLGRKLAEFYFLEKEKKEIEMALLDADKRYLIFRETFPTLEQQIPQYHIASYLGVSATQLSRIRKKMSEQ